MTAHSEPTRKRLPDSRPSITRKGTVCGHELYVTVGFYNEIDDHDQPGEVFVKVAKHGSVLAGLVDGWCVMTSISLQYGVPWEKISDKFKFTQFGSTEGDPENTSLLDGICKLVDEVVEYRRGIVGTDEIKGE